MRATARHLDRDEARAALESLDLFTTASDFEKIFLQLDVDASGTLDWEVSFEAVACI